MTPSHIACFEQVETIATLEGKEVLVWRLNIPENNPLLSEWAAHFRNHYCLDEELGALCAGTGLSHKDYLIDLIFPDRSEAPGPAVRAGDFAEILVSDYLEYVLGYWVPRDKYAEKAVRNESIKGVDVVGFHLADGTVESQNPIDELVAFEVKAKLTGKRYEQTLQDAVNHSQKDFLRRALTLNATKRRLRSQGRIKESLIVQRYQNPTDHPYVYKSGAAAIISEVSYDAELIGKDTVAHFHPNVEQLDLVVIFGSDLMNLLTSLYDRAADEA